MKHSIRYIQVNYSGSGRGQKILMLRGMEMRAYHYSVRRFDAVLDACNHKFEIYSNSNRITFTKVYPK